MSYCIIFHFLNIGRWRPERVAERNGDKPVYYIIVKRKTCFKNIFKRQCVECIFT